MKTLQEIKDQYARDLGYPNWWSLDFNKTNLSQEAIRDKVSELYAQSRVSELERENEKMKAVIAWADEELSRLKSGKESQLKEENLRLEKEVETLRDDLTNKQLIYEFASWLQGENFTNPDISIHEWVNSFFIKRLTPEHLDKNSSGE